MVTKFTELPEPWWGKVLQTYLILVGYATHRETTTYPMLANQLAEDVRSINGFLYLIHEYCGRNNLFHLNVLVVSAITGEPGRSYLEPRESIYTEREGVYNYDWLSDVPPTTTQLMEA